MARKSRGRGTAAAFGLLLVLAGLAGGTVLYVLSVQRPDQAIDGFARAPIGCTTTLEFTETGTFYVFQERGTAVPVPEGGCQPIADASQTFGFELRGPDGPVPLGAEGTLSYDTDDFSGVSAARVQIDTPGQYEIVVVGDDAGVVAAIGRDPHDGVSELRQLAIMVAAVGVILGAVLLVLSGRRSKRAATFSVPDPPVWSPYQGGPDLAAPEYTRVAQIPVDPHATPESESTTTELPPLEGISEQTAVPKRASPWAPPTPDQAAVAPGDGPESGRPADGN
jgi:hypothetical protein